jgi:site-specific recombinase XerD
MEDLRRARQVQGLSADAAELWMSAWRTGTQTAYDSCWRKWTSWCSKQQIDPFQATVENVANFLSHLYTQGYEYRTINNYRTAISAIHPEIEGSKVGQMHTIRQVMTGIFNKRPPLPRYTSTWNVDNVLHYIQGMAPNELLALKELTLKAAMLIALTTAARASEICKLDINYMQITDNEISFVITDLTKTRKINDESMTVTLCAYKEEKIDVRACIVHYLNVTDPIRQFSKLLVSYTKPHKAIKPCTVARWLKTMLTSVGIDTNIFKAHSTRGASTSKANKFGLSVEQIMKKANWKSATTLQKFYKKPVIGEDVFAQTVLSVE